MKHRLTPIDYEIIDRLKAPRTPWAYKVGSVWEQDIEQIQKLRILTDALVELEKVKDNLELELVNYKMAYGEL